MTGLSKLLMPCYRRVRRTVQAATERVRTAVHTATAESMADDTSCLTHGQVLEPNDTESNLLQDSDASVQCTETNDMVNDNNVNLNKIFNFFSCFDFVENLNFYDVYDDDQLIKNCFGQICYEQESGVFTNDADGISRKEGVVEPADQASGLMLANKPGHSKPRKKGLNTQPSRKRKMAQPAKRICKGNDGNNSICIGKSIDDLMSNQVLIDNVVHTLPVTAVGPFEVYVEPEVAPPIPVCSEGQLIAQEIVEEWDIEKNRPLLCSHMAKLAENFWEEQTHTVTSEEPPVIEELPHPIYSMCFPAPKIKPKKYDSSLQDVAMSCSLRRMIAELRQWEFLGFVNAEKERREYERMLHKYRGLPSNELPLVLLDYDRLSTAELCDKSTLLKIAPRSIQNAHEIQLYNLLDLEINQSPVVFLDRHLEKPCFQLATEWSISAPISMMQKSTFHKLGGELRQLMRCVHYHKIQGHNQSHTIYGGAFVRFKIGGVEYEHFFHIIDDHMRLPLAILGLDFMQMHPPTLNRKMGYAVIGGKRIQLGPPPEPFRGFVRLKDQVILRPGQKQTGIIGILYSFENTPPTTGGDGNFYRNYRRESNGASPSSSTNVDNSIERGDC